MGKKWIFIISINIFLVALVLISVEVILNLVKYNYYPIDIEIKKISERNDFREFHAFQHKDLVYDKDLLWTPNKDIPLFNEQGFIGPVLETDTNTGNASDSSYIIFTIGDSNTNGEPTGVSWPRFLGELYDNSNTKVINAGVWGYSSYQGLIRFEKIIPFKPDMAIISFGSNDAHQVLIPDNKWIPNNNHYQKSKQTAFSKTKLSVLIQEFTDRAKMFLHKGTKLVPRVSLEDYRNNLTKMIDLAKKNNIQIVLLTRPFVYIDEGEKNNPDWTTWKAYAPIYNDEVRSIAKEYNVPLIDVYSEFENKNDLFQDESHFTEEADKMMAEYVYNSIENIINTKNNLDD